MKRTNLLFLTIIFFIMTISISFSYNFSSDNFSKNELEEKTESETTDREKSLEGFDKMMQVLTHKRCVNCHPAGDRPHQGEDSHIHNFNVQRGVSNFGSTAFNCNTCHHEENNDIAGIPGAPEWSLAPKEMYWEGLSRVEIANSMMNPEINGGRDLEHLVEHLTEHALVLWAWNPGVDHEGNEREKPPVPKDEYIAAVKQWAENGAVIPEK
ncbi:MAG: hypothetical protein AB8H03_27830 [Saprospiraceae bacterium]